MQTIQCAAGSGRTPHSTKPRGAATPQGSNVESSGRKNDESKVSPPRSRRKGAPVQRSGGGPAAADSRSCSALTMHFLAATMVAIGDASRPAARADRMREHARCGGLDGIVASVLEGAPALLVAEAFVEALAPMVTYEHPPQVRAVAQTAMRIRSAYTAGGAAELHARAELLEMEDQPDAAAVAIAYLFSLYLKAGGEDLGTEEPELPHLGAFAVMRCLGELLDAERLRTVALRVVEAAGEMRAFPAARPTWRRSNRYDDRIGSAARASNHLPHEGGCDVPTAATVRVDPRARPQDPHEWILAAREHGLAGPAAVAFELVTRQLADERRADVSSVLAWLDQARAGTDDAWNAGDAWSAALSDLANVYLPRSIREAEDDELDAADERVKERLLSALREALPQIAQAFDAQAGTERARRAS